MKYKKEGKRISVFINGDLNYTKVKQLKKDISENSDEIDISFSCSKFIDSEGIKFLYSLYKQGKKLKLVNPPTLFEEAVKILSLDELLETIERN